MSLADEILGITEKVTKEWTKQRKAEERGRRSRSSREYVYSERVYFTEVAAQILPPAYAHASGGGKYSVAKRQLYTVAEGESASTTPWCGGYGKLKHQAR